MILNKRIESDAMKSALDKKEMLNIYVTFIWLRTLEIQTGTRASCVFFILIEHAKKVVFVKAPIHLGRVYTTLSVSGL